MITVFLVTCNNLVYFAAAFKIIKSWLPAKAVQKIKFVNRGTLKEYVEPSQALKAWGGTDEYQFVFTPEPSPAEWVKDENKKKVFSTSAM